MRCVPAAAAIAALALSAPGSALAQSAGDDQYRDPFAGQGSGGQEQPQQPAGGGGSSGGSTSAPVAPSAPATVPAAPASSATTSGTLPYTGLPAGLVSGAGLLLMAAGFGLRRASR